MSKGGRGETGDRTRDTKEGRGWERSEEIGS